MKHRLKWIHISILLLGSCFILGGCKEKTSDELVLRVANCEEYIDEGDWDEPVELSNGTVVDSDKAMVDAFEDWYYETYGKKIHVEYSTYGTNEDLYNQLTLGSEFDLVCPSEYMILKMMNEGKVQPFSDAFFDESDENNYYIKGLSPYIRDVFENLTIDDKRMMDYGAGYMWGSMGVVYNPEKVDEEDLHHWSILLSPKYNKQVTMKDSIRDSYIVALCVLNEEKFQSKDFLNDPNYGDELSKALNATDEETVNQVEKILSKMRENSYSLETDSGKADMVSGKVVANMQWSGDAVYTMDQAEEDDFELDFFIPEEASNLWFDGFCMLKDGIRGNKEKQQAAEAFINFISRPDNVIRNMNYIGYTSAISGGESEDVLEYVKYCYEDEEGVPYDLSYFFGDETVIYVPEEQLHRQLLAQYPTEDVIKRCAVMSYYDKDANKRISQMWTNIRCFTFPWEH